MSTDVYIWKTFKNHRKAPDRIDRRQSTSKNGCKVFAVTSAAVRLVSQFSWAIEGNFAY